MQYITARNKITDNIKPISLFLLKPIKFLFLLNNSEIPFIKKNSVAIKNKTEIQIIDIAATLTWSIPFHVNG